MKLNGTAVLFLTVSILGASVYLFGARRRNMKITSEAFAYGGLIPKQYTCDGLMESPPLEFDNVPSDTKSLALIVENPESEIGEYVQWVVFNLPPVVRSLPVSADIKQLGGIVGTNTDGLKKYYGLCPGAVMRSYNFTLYALDTMLNLDENATKKDLLKAMEGHILTKADLMGKYKRVKPVTRARL
jgi:Raf kinase inhibitor-like YbhB/YbcL family protein